MDLIIRPTTLTGSVLIPGSKSHTIRGVAFGSLADGETLLEQPLVSADALAAINAYRALGATIDRAPDDSVWRIRGFNGQPAVPSSTIDVENSGATLSVSRATAALLPDGQSARFDGDHQIRRRPAGPLLDALNMLGARAVTDNANGCPPLSVTGRLNGGKAVFPAPSSQYVTALLVNAPFADGDTELELTLLNEAPYVEMTLDWMSRLGLRVDASDDRLKYRIPGGQRIAGFRRRIPADFSTATFFLAAGALPGNAVSCLPLDMNDTQGDKAVIEYLERIGARIRREPSAMTVGVQAEQLTGIDIDMNATPDAVPMFAALGCFCDGNLRLVNVKHARIKETDRIAVMAEELSKMGATVKTMDDGMEVTGNGGGWLTGAVVDGRGDHRVVMSLAIAATRATGETRILGADSAAVTFPAFLDALRSLGADAQPG